MPRTTRELNKADGELLIWALIETGQYPKPNESEAIVIEDILYSGKCHRESEVGFWVRVRCKESNALIRADYLCLEHDGNTFPERYTLTIYLGFRYVSGVRHAPETRLVSSQTMIDWLFCVGLLERLDFPTQLRKDNRSRTTSIEILKAMHDEKTAYVKENRDWQFPTDDIDRGIAIGLEIAIEALQSAV